MWLCAYQIYAEENVFAIFGDVDRICTCERDEFTPGKNYTYYHHTPFRSLTEDERALFSRLQTSEKTGGIVLEGISHMWVCQRKGGDYFLLEEGINNQSFGAFTVTRVRARFKMVFQKDKSPLIAYYYIPKP